MFAGIKGFVVEIPSGKMECYVSSNLEKSSIEHCLRCNSYSSQQFHSECSSVNFYQSIMQEVFFGELLFTIFDKKASQPSSLPDIPCTMSWISTPTISGDEHTNEKRLKCAVPSSCSKCQKTFSSSVTLSRHLKRTCKNTRLDNEESMLVDNTESSDLGRLNNFLDLHSRPAVQLTLIKKTARNHFSRSRCKQHYKAFNIWIRQSKQKSWILNYLA